MIVEKLQQIYTLIQEIEAEDKVAGGIVRRGFELSFDLLQKVAQNDGKLEELDVSDQIKMVTEVLGYDVEQLVIQAITEFNDQMDIEQKAADEATLAFITADEEVDDYERFIEENKVKENLDFLKGEV
jgi:hypothetical protein